MKRSKTSVHFLVEEGILVRGTLDPHEALRLAIDSNDGYLYDCVRDVDRKAPIDPVMITAFGNHLHGLLSGAKPGLYRMNVAREDDWQGCAWYLGHGRQRGRGVFEGVTFP